MHAAAQISQVTGDARRHFQKQGPSSRTSNSCVSSSQINSCGASPRAQSCCGLPTYSDSAREDNTEQPGQPSRSRATSQFGVLGGCIGRSTHRTRCPGLKEHGQCTFRNVKKLKWHLRTFCHCYLNMLWRKDEGSIPTAKSSEQMQPANTLERQLALLKGICTKLESAFRGMSPQMRDKVMLKMDGIARLTDASLLLAEPSMKSQVECPWWQGKVLSLDLAALISLQMLEDESGSGVVSVLRLDEPGHICISDTFGKKLVLRGTERGVVIMSQHIPEYLHQHLLGLWQCKGSEIWGTPFLNLYIIRCACFRTLMNPYTAPQTPLNPNPKL